MEFLMSCPGFVNWFLRIADEKKPVQASWADAVPE